MNGYKKIKLSPLFFSLFIHGLGFLFLNVFPLTKSIVFFKIQKKETQLFPDAREKILEEIQVVQIPKKHEENTVAEWLSEDIGYISQEKTDLPHLDFSPLLAESMNFDFPIDESSSWSLQNLERVERSYENYLSPIYQSLPDDLLGDTEPVAQNYEPHVKPFISETPSTPPVSQIEDFDYSSFVTDLPEMLDTELYSYKDENKNDYFRMELRLKDHKLFEDKPEDFLFVIDLTQKDIKNNIESYKEAILKSAAILKAKDRFNVVLINKQPQYLFDKMQSIHTFKASMMASLSDKTVQTNGKFSDFLKNLGKIFDKTEESDVHTHCIMFTNEPLQNQDDLIKLSRFAHSKLSIYPVLLPQKNTVVSYLSLVEQMGGRLLHLPTKASFIRKLSGLIMDIKRTKLSNVFVRVSADENPIEVSLSEKTKQLTLKKPLKIFGKLNGAQTLRLHVTGSHGEDMYEMKKTMFVNEAKKGSSLIKQDVINSENNE